MSISFSFFLCFIVSSLFCFLSSKVDELHWMMDSLTKCLPLLQSLLHDLTRKRKSFTFLPFYITHMQIFSDLSYSLTYGNLCAKPLGVKLCSIKSCSAPATKKLAKSTYFKIIYRDKHAAEQPLHFTLLLVFIFKQFTPHHTIIV